MFMLLGVPPRMGRKIFLWLSISVFLFFFSAIYISILRPILESLERNKVSSKSFEGGS